MGSLTSFNFGIKYFLTYVIDVFRKYVWVKPSKGKKVWPFPPGFIEIINQSKRQPNKPLVDQGRYFYNNLMQKWLEFNDILKYLTHNEGKSVDAERFVRTSKIFANIILVI